MNKILAFLLCLLAAFIVQKASAQSCCAGGAASNYTLLPTLDKNVVALRYSFGSYLSESHVFHPESHHHSGTESVAVKEQLHMLEIFGRFNVAPRLQLSVFVPVNLIQRQEPQQRLNGGLGDMTLLLQYSFLKPVFCGNPKPKHQLRGGVGTKLPSGDFGKRKDGEYITNLQPGSGSIDFLGNLIYTFRYRQFGFNTGLVYKLNTVNPQGYYFGNKEQANVRLFYLFDVSHVQLMPTAGLSYEHQHANRYQKETITGTEGHFFGASAGLDVYYKQFAFSAALIPAFLTRLNGTAYSRGKMAAEVGVFYNFSTITLETH